MTDTGKVISDISDYLNEVGGALITAGTGLEKLSVVLKSASTNQTLISTINSIESVITNVGGTMTHIESFVDKTKTEISTEIKNVEEYAESKLGRKYTRKIGGKKYQKHVKLTYNKKEILQTPTIDLRGKDAGIYDQTTVGSCTANCLAELYEFDEILQKEKSEFTPSRLFIYYNERKMEGTVDQDAGAEIGDGIQSMKETGVCPEDMWPYIPERFTVAPTPECYEAAKNHRTAESHAISQDFASLYAVLKSGIPFGVGIVLYESFESDKVAKTGQVKMPRFFEKQLGGHAVVCVGWNNEKQTWIMRNSWGKDWGMNGYFTLPKQYLLKPSLADEFWCVTSVTDLMN